MFIAGYRYFKDGDYLVPGEAAYNSKGSFINLPYGNVNKPSALEGVLHSMMRDGRLAIPYKYCSNIKPVSSKIRSGRAMAANIVHNIDCYLSEVYYREARGVNNVK